MTLLLAALLVSAPTKTGTINVNSSVAGAKVYLDDKTAGTVPLIIKNVVAGSHKIKVKKLGYLAAEASVTVLSGDVSEVMLDLLPYAGVLQVKAVPKGAQVFVDGRGVGVVPYEGEISIGRRSVEVKRDGYLSYREGLTVGAGEVYKIDAQLQRGVEPNSGADVPLVALAPKKKKKVDAGTDEDIPLEAPLLARPGRSGTQPDSPGLVAIEKAPPQWYQKWWVWAIVGGVVVAGVTTAVVVTQTNQTPALDFGPFQLNAPSPSR